MALLSEGIWPCVVLSGSFGVDENDSPKVQINVKFTDGPNKDRLATYEDQVNNKSALYIARSCKAVGFKGGSMTTLGADIEAFIKATGGATTAEVKHIEITKGKKHEKWVAGGCDPTKKPIWDKVNSIGRGPQVLKAAGTERLSDADEAIRNAMALEGETAGGGSTPEDDIPFVTCDIAYEPSPIAKVLR